MFHVSAAGLAFVRVGDRVRCLLIDDEESEESRREVPYGIVHLVGREIVLEHGVLVAPCVVLRDELQFFFRFRDFTSL